TFLGGSASSSTCSLGIGDVGFDIALDSTNNAYVTGSTCSFDFPIHDAFQGGLKDPMHGDAFVTKLSPDGTSLIYSTFLGGTGAGTSGDLAEGIAVDSSGNAYVTGSAASTNFPTQNAFQGANKAPSGSTNAFVTKFAAFGPTPTPTPTATVTPTPTATPTPSLAALTAAPSSATLKAKVGKSKSKKVKLTNKKKTAGGASINITSATVATAVFAASTNCNGAVLAPGKSCSVTVTFTPSSATTFADTLTVSSNAANGVQKTTLSGVGH
ncbi:MAG: SBBP repeat-containing protein, partial [Steroidobacteraceae bacterium]